jgi:hypothetical protein
LSKASPSTNTLTVEGMLLKCEDWKDLIGKVRRLSSVYFRNCTSIMLVQYLRNIEKGPSPTTLTGPILPEVPYPGVLVAKAYSPNSRDLDLVFYPSAEAGTFTIGVERLEPGVRYNIGEKETVIANKEGKVKFDVELDRRTAVLLTPVELK